MINRRSILLGAAFSAFPGYAFAHPRPFAQPRKARLAGDTPAQHLLGLRQHDRNAAPAERHRRLEAGRPGAPVA